MATPPLNYFLNAHSILCCKESSQQMVLYHLLFMIAMNIKPVDLKVTDKILQKSFCNCSRESVVAFSSWGPVQGKKMIQVEKSASKPSH